MIDEKNIKPLPQIIDFALLNLVQSILETWSSQQSWSVSHRIECMWMACCVWFITAADCYELGRVAYNNRDYYHTVCWIQEALIQWEKEENKTIDKPTLLDYLAYCLYMVSLMCQHSHICIVNLTESTGMHILIISSLLMSLLYKQFWCKVINLF